MFTINRRRRATSIGHAPTAAVDVRRSKVVKLCVVVVALALAFSLAALLGLGEYLRLLRPQSLKQLDPDMVRLVNELAHVDHQNEFIVGRLFAHGGAGKAELGGDRVWRVKVKVVDGEYLWNPAVIVMKEAGILEMEFSNPDTFAHHAAYLPSNGNRVLMTLPPLKNGRARIELDGPGLYWFGCPVSNHAGRGMLGLILVRGEVPEEARLDRPKQDRP